MMEEDVRGGGGSHDVIEEHQPGVIEEPVAVVDEHEQAQGDEQPPGSHQQPHPLKIFWNRVANFRRPGNRNQQPIPVPPPPLDPELVWPLLDHFSTPPLPPDVYINRELEARIEHLEKQRDELIKDETDVDKRCDDIAQLLMTHLGVYVMMSGAMAVSGLFVCKDRAFFYLYLFFHFMMFASGFGVSAYVSICKLTKMGWRFIRIEDGRIELKAAANSLASDLETFDPDSQNQNDQFPSLRIAKHRVARLLATLRSDSGSFKKDHVMYITATIIGAAIFLYAVLAGTYILHPVAKTLMEGYDLFTLTLVSNLMMTNNLTSTAPLYMAT